jgi:hypothetical protein
MSVKSERLKKLETELEDLFQWKKLGLVPKKDTDKHNEEIHQLKEKIEEEKERLRFIKENGDNEEYIAPKRNNARQAYAEPQTLPEMDIDNSTEAGIDMESETFFLETASGEESEGPKEDATSVEEEDDEDPFSDKNRWKRGVLEDPDANDW